MRFHLSLLLLCTCVLWLHIRPLFAVPPLIYDCSICVELQALNTSYELIDKAITVSMIHNVAMEKERMSDEIFRYLFF